MTDLEMIESLYPEGAPLSPDERSQLRAELFGMVTVQPSASEATSNRRVMALAAALLLGCGAAGVWLTLDRTVQEGGADFTTVTPPQATVPMASSTMPAPRTVPSASSVETTTSTVEVTAPPVIDDASTLFELSAEVGATIDHAFAAIDEQTQACLRERGVEGVPTPTYLLGIGRIMRADELPWKMPNGSPATEGYAHAPDRVYTEVIDPPGGSPAFNALYGDIVGTWSEADPAREPASAVGGDLRDGCLPVAMLEILGDGDPMVAEDLGDAAYRLSDAFYAGVNTVARDQRYAAALTEWTACMRELGIETTAPEDLARRDWGSEGPTAAELATATSDAGCRASTRLSDVGDELFDAAVIAYFAEHPTLIDAIRAIMLAVNARVAQLDVP